MSAPRITPFRDRCADCGRKWWDAHAEHCQETRFWARYGEIALPPVPRVMLELQSEWGRVVE